MYKIVYNWVNIHFQLILMISIAGMLIFTVLIALNRWKKLVNILLAFMACLYVALLLYVTLGIRTTSGKSAYNIVPLWTYFDILKYGKRYLLWENAANVVMFLPLGMFLKNLEGKKLHWYGSVFVGMMFSAGIELLQLLTKHGFCDIDDVLHNTLGVLIGYLLTCGILFAVKQVNRLRNEGS